MIENAALMFTYVACVAIGFQIALVAGLPWGEWTMGGKYPGKLPGPVRVLALVQAFILALLVVVVHGAAGLRIKTFPDWYIWIVVGFSAISLVMNLITPSAKERKVWAPAAALMLIGSVIVAVAT